MKRKKIQMKIGKEIKREIKNGGRWEENNGEKKGYGEKRAKEKVRRPRAKKAKKKREISGTVRGVGGGSKDKEKERG